jgi:hypothetical protein
MTIKEQIRRILKAAPYLPIQAVQTFAYLIAIPILINLILTSFSTEWVEGKATILNYTAVQERTKDEEVEYFYSIGYDFSVVGHHYTTPFEKSYDDKRVAEIDLQQIIADSRPATLFYDASNPSNVKFTNPNGWWILYSGLLVLVILLLMYNRWLMLKYYELEME